MTKPKHCCTTCAYFKDKLVDAGNEYGTCIQNPLKDEKIPVFVYCAYWERKTKVTEKELDNNNTILIFDMLEILKMKVAKLQENYSELLNTVSQLTVLMMQQQDFKVEKENK